ncbi:MAG: aldehyde dehydrogenase family protein [Pseudomonadota bacterium]
MKDISPAPAIEAAWRNFVDGAWCEGENGDRLTVMDPASAQPLAEVALAGAADVGRAVETAKRVATSRALSGIRPLDRCAMVQEMGRLLKKRADETAQIICRDVGKSLNDAKGEALAAARYFEYFGAAASQIEGQYIPLADGLTTYVKPEAYGVVAHVIPWNFPHLMVARSLAPALAAGNANVVKAPELAPLSCYVFAEAAMEAGFPAGAVNVLCGTGAEAGAALVSHAGVDLIVFTGSVPTGQAILRASAAHIVPSVLELGGKSAAIVRPDADIETVLENVRIGIFENAGQVCDAMSRLIVEPKHYEHVVEAVAEMASRLTLGPGWENADITPLISDCQKRRVMAAVDAGQAAGAHIAYGGGSCSDHAGYFHEPTVFAGVTADMDLNRKEVFGPVLSILPAENLDHAITLANGTDYGLASGVFTRDLDAALWCADRLDAGLVHINEWALGSCETPFGGTKQSGIGRERGREGLASYYQSKSVNIRHARPW